VITGTTIAVAPKGDMIAFTTISVAGFRMWLRRIDELNARVVTELAAAIWLSLPTAAGSRSQKAIC
jgi:hypothetical protein